MRVGAQLLCGLAISNLWASDDPEPGGDKSLPPRAYPSQNPRCTFDLEGIPGVAHSLPRGWDVQEDGIRHVAHAEAASAHVLIAHSHPAAHAVLLELLPRLLRPLLVELHRVQVARGCNGADDGVGHGATAGA